MFAETGLMVGFFLPGDSLLFLAGVAASPVANEIVGVRVPLSGLLIGTPIFAIAGAQLGHFFGARYGPRLFIRPESRLLNPVAGARKMPARRFFVWNVVGGLLWTDGILLAGYALARQITKLIPAEKIDTYLLPVIALIVLLSATPIFIEVFRTRRAKRRADRQLEAIRLSGPEQGVQED